jgi:thiosulfate/3-mercaptopyruvate sulfurtransferase
MSAPLAGVVMSSIDSSPLVDTTWLAAHAGDPGVRIIDVRWQSRYENGRGVSLDDRDGYRAGHIPGAVFAGMIAELSDPEHPVPDMLAPPDRFAAAMSRVGVGHDTLVVAYDNMGLPLGSARLWWALNYYGHDKVRVLDGGLRQWVNEGRPLTTDVPHVQAATFVASSTSSWLATKQDVSDALGQPGTVLVDCLTPELYQGRGDRHLWGQRPGHIPGAVNVPYLANVDPALAEAPAADRARILAERRDFTFSSPEKLAVLYTAAGISNDRRVITYCGRGYAAACGMLALKLLGYGDVRLYDGSRTEWSADPSLPAEISAGGKARESKS